VKGMFIGRRGKQNHEMAEEEGFKLRKYKAGHSLVRVVCYSRNAETKGFTFSRMNTGFL
jgi:hypothetical protein